MVWKHLFQPFMLNVEICPKWPQRGKYCFVWQGKIFSENFLLFGLNIFISPQLCMRYTTIIPYCGGDSSIHASQYKQYEIDWHLCRLSEVHLQHKLKLFVPMSFPRNKAHPFNTQWGRVTHWSFSIIYCYILVIWMQSLWGIASLLCTNVWI